MQTKQKKHLIGITTIGEKGQVVIPADIRAMLKLKKGEKLIAITRDEEGIMLTRLEHFESFAQHVNDGLIAAQSLHAR